MQLVVSLVGVMVYIASDYSASPLGLAYAVANVISSVCEQVVQRRLLADSPVAITFPGMLLLNNGVALLPELALMLALREWGSWADVFRSQVGPLDYALLGASCIAGLLIGWSGINAQRELSAMGMLVLANFDKAILILASMVVDGTANIRKVVGVLVALLGAFSFGAMRQHASVTTKDLKAITTKDLPDSDGATGGFLRTWFPGLSASKAQIGVLCLSCSFYAVCSTATTIVNKLLASVVPLSVVAIQMGAAVVLFCVFPCCLHVGSWKDAFNWATGVSVLWGVNTAIAMVAYKCDTARLSPRPCSLFACRHASTGWCTRRATRRMGGSCARRLTACCSLSRLRCVARLDSRHAKRAPSPPPFPSRHQAEASAHCTSSNAPPSILPDTNAAPLSEAPPSPSCIENAAPRIGTPPLLPALADVAPHHPFHRVHFR